MLTFNGQRGSTKKITIWKVHADLNRWTLISQHEFRTTGNTCWSSTINADQQRWKLMYEICTLILTDEGWSTKKTLDSGKHLLTIDNHDGSPKMGTSVCKWTIDLHRLTLINQYEIWSVISMLKFKHQRRSTRMGINAIKGTRRSLRMNADQPQWILTTGKQMLNFNN